jgi:NADPH:quinone reductase-like Zn-dependent oxidoreductase/SAM-dependent methyltransferase/acyl carrier protein
VGVEFEPEKLANELRIIPAHRRLFGRFLEILAEDNVLELRDNSGRWLRPLPVTDIAATMDELGKSFPEFEATLAMTARCGARLSVVLTGQTDPLRLLFPAGDLTTAENIYQHSPSARTLNSLVREAIRAVANAWSADRPLRILEVGAGTGGTTAHVLAALPLGRAQYLFTDLSPLFLARAKVKFADFQNVSFQLLNLEDDLPAQGLSANGFDIIIASNVIHATADVTRSLASVRRLLAPGGWLLMLEVTQPQRWFEVTFGLTDGWWRFRDHDLRRRYPVLPRAEWKRLLLQSGFDQTLIVPEIGLEKEETEDEAMLIARAALDRTAVITKQPAATARRWLILADRQGMGQQLAKRLVARGDHCALAFARGDTNGPSNEADVLDPKSPEDMERLLLLHTTGNKEPFYGIVYLWSLDATPLDELDEISAEGEVQSWCGGALHLVQALARRAWKEPPRLWLCTRGAQKVDNADKVLSPAAATVWGLGKVVALEHPELRCVRLDLAPHSTANEIEFLSAALEDDDTEDQVALRASRRWGARLQRIKKPADNADSFAPLSGKPYHLSFTSRGSLENLKWETTNRRPPGPGEVEIRVHTTALNFRDVMNTMGQGDPGPLGLECAGEIVALGKGIDHFALGDAVVAVAPDSFAGYVTTNAQWVAAKPVRMSFDEVVTVPIVFITAHFSLNHLAKIQTDDRVLIHAAAGGVGLAAVALAKRAGAEIFATAGSPEKRAFLNSLGVSHVMDSRSLGFAEEIMKITEGRGVDVVLNSLIDRFMDRSFDIIAQNGRFLEIGKRGIWEPARVARLNRGIQYFIVDWSVDLRNNPALIESMFQQLMAAFDRGELESLPHRVFRLQDAKAAFRFMAQGRHVGKVVMSHEQTLRAGTAGSNLDPQGTYLITGGLHGVGLMTAQWLVERGARHLVLTGRRSPDAEAVAVLRALESRGIDVRVAEADASDAGNMKRLLEDTRRTMPLLRGVIHSAGALDDGVLLKQSWDRFATVFAAKVTGSLLLHRLTASDALDFFVLFSSIAAVFGSPGQGNHVAANAFMDTLAAARATAGMRGLSINWGAWTGAGAVVDRDLTARARETGYGVIDPQGGFLALEAALNLGRSQVIVLPADWARLLPQVSREGHLRKFLTNFTGPSLAARREPWDRVADGGSIGESMSGSGGSQTTPSFADRLAAVAPNQRGTLVIDQIRRDTARVLGLENSELLPNNKPLNELGLDSLMAVELCSCLSGALGRSLPATLLYDYPTLGALARYLSRSVLGLEEAPAGLAPSSSVSGGSDVLDEIENLDEDEIERLLKERGTGTQ